MTVNEVYNTTAESFVFIKDKDGLLKEYCGQKELAGLKVVKITATRYPMYNSVLELQVKEVAHD